MNRIARWRGYVQGLLFPGVEADLEEPMTEEHRQVVKVLEVVRVEKHVREVQRWCGGPRASRRAMARAFGEFATSRLRDAVHGALVEQFAQPLFVGHVARDRTEMVARERAAQKPKRAPRRRVRGHAKVQLHLHLMLEVIVLFADQLLNLAATWGAAQHSGSVSRGQPQVPKGVTHLRDLHGPSQRPSDQTA